ncbi:GNAT family N-acetyltransferase [Nocardioides mesophilus]|uniref:N-acetyltransferase domain-containing protein n=1 Tax=Nocardioides mesophilus TaxID=433659 RepID=A0A7G9R7X9_9ACTN|nr:GNAT family N-acetyltransferase [Nocardioides mesophilus]QNN51704.1 hypothetical protein H9L09_14190 [Nocardioides mesophilus]
MDSNAVPSLTFQPLPADEAGAWLDRERDRRAQRHIAGGAPREAADHRATTEVETLRQRLHEGALHLWSTDAGERSGGTVAVDVHETSQGREAFVLSLDPEVMAGPEAPLLVDGLEAALAEQQAAWLRLEVPPQASALFEGRGYQRLVTETVRTLRGGPPHPPPEGLPRLNLRDMDPTQFEEYIAHSKQQRAREMAKAGALPAAEAESAASRDVDALLPRGIDTPGNVFLVGYDGNTAVGTLWLTLRKDADGLHAFGQELRIHDDVQRQGYAWAFLFAVNELLQSRNVTTVAARVYGYNAHLSRMLASFGHRERSVQYKKALSA